MTELSTADRRKAVMSVLDDAARSAGIPRELLGGIWGKESSYGKHLTSPTGCEGDFQFLASTWAGMIKNDGAKIAARLRATGHEDLAATVENYQRGLKNGTVDKKDAALQALRDDPYVSTYAAAYLIKETARAVHANPNNKAQWGDIYAGYNVGPQAARDLRGKLADTENCKEHLGVAAKANPAFFVRRATGTEALERYQNSIEHYADDFSAAAAKGFASAPRKSQAARRQETPAAPVVVAPPVTSSSKQQAPAKADYFNDIVAKYLGDGEVHRYKGTIVKYGICQSANPNVDVANLTREQALEVYRTKYWNGINGIDRMTKEQAAAAFDVSYRHGPEYANRVVPQPSVAAAERKPESLTTTFVRGTDPARAPVVTSTATPPKQDSLSGNFLRSAVHYVTDFFAPSAATKGMPEPCYI